MDHKKRKSDKCVTDRSQGGRGQIQDPSEGGPHPRVREKEEDWFKNPKLDERKSTFLGDSV